MNENAIAQQKSVKGYEWFPVRCSVCGREIRKMYVSAERKKIYATCSIGHKTSYPALWPEQKAV